MRIVDSVIIAVVSLAALSLGWQTSRSPNSSESSWDFSYEGEEYLSSEIDPGKWLSFRESQMLLRREGGDRGAPVDCCPSILEMVEPKGGTNQEGIYVHLFSEGDIRQRFYELSCRQEVEGKPCRFMDRKLHNQSKCVQKYSYSYAIVRKSAATSSEVLGGSSSPTRHHHGGGSRLSHFLSGTSSDWSLDYIRVRSGCSCELTPRPKRKRAHRKRTRPANTDNNA